jgi:hypothetical protein
MVFNATFNNISVISWRSVLLVEEIGVPEEHHRPVASHWQTFIPSMVIRNRLFLIGRCNSQQNMINFWWALVRLGVQPVPS